jgi:hypothetical protein
MPVVAPVTGGPSANEEEREIVFRYRSGKGLILYDESLQDWRDSVEASRRSEWLLGWSLRVTRATITFSKPLWMIATGISAVLAPLHQWTGGRAFLPLQWLVLSPLMATLLLTSDLWTKSASVRPFLLVMAPPGIGITMAMISLIPDDPDARRAKHVLCELWPLSQRRIRWIAVHGTGE